MLAQHLGIRAFVSDGGYVQPEKQAALEAYGADYEFGLHVPAHVCASDWVVKSPGIPTSASIVQSVEKAGIALMSEIEFVYRLYPALRWVAITGSNGKTTTSSLIHHILFEAGADVGLGGNIGKSIARLLVEKPQPGYVLEVSSFQLDDVQMFRPQIAVLLNITPDHLDRYQDDIAAYAEAKYEITAAQTAADIFICNLSDPLSKAYMPSQIAAQVHGFADAPHPEATAWLEGNEIVHRDGTRYTTESMSLRGKHNAMNAAAAVLAARAWGIVPEKIQQGLNSFTPIAHRLEHVPTSDGRNWVNDSKATNVDAVMYALDAMTQPTVWIAGGVDKGNDYTELDVSRVKALIILGPDYQKLKAQYEGEIPVVVRVTDMKAAVQEAQKLSEVGDDILLSPACASFDLFQNYEDRGRQFVEAVRHFTHSQSLNT